MDSDGGNRSEYNYKDKTLKCCSNTPADTVLVFSRYGVGSNSTVMSFGADGSVTGQTNVRADIRRVYAGDGRISALTPQGYLQSDLSLRNPESANISGDMIDSLTIQNNVYIFGLQAVYQYRVK